MPAVFNALDAVGKTLYPTAHTGERMFRKFAAFYGPFEHFLFLDADIIVLSALDWLMTRLLDSQADFIFFDTSPGWVYADPAFQRRMEREHGARGFANGAYVSRKGFVGVEELSAACGERDRLKQVLSQGCLRSAVHELHRRPERRKGRRLLRSRSGTLSWHLGCGAGGHNRPAAATARRCSRDERGQDPAAVALGRVPVRLPNAESRLLPPLQASGRAIVATAYAVPVPLPAESPAARAGSARTAAQRRVTQRSWGRQRPGSANGSQGHPVGSFLAYRAFHCPQIPLRQQAMRRERDQRCRQAGAPGKAAPWFSMRAPKPARSPRGPGYPGMMPSALGRTPAEALAPTATDQHRQPQVAGHAPGRQANRIQPLPALRLSAVSSRSACARRTPPRGRSRRACGGARPARTATSRGAPGGGGRPSRPARGTGARPGSRRAKAGRGATAPAARSAPWRRCCRAEGGRARRPERRFRHRRWPAARRRARSSHPCPGRSSARRASPASPAGGRRSRRRRPGPRPRSAGRRIRPVRLRTAARSTGTP